ncbi:MAG: phosphoribosylanthranilate isomerase [Rhizobiales bacterium]|nr:phosphoribosylanthranilate isomerase [Hyphomicrobiales bacterium]
MKLIVKICGLSTEETLDAALAAGADMVGLVFFPPSPRYVTLERAAALAARARGRAEIVALSVDMAERNLGEIVDMVRPDWLQLHGSETPDRVAAIKKRFSRRVVKAVGIREAADLATAQRYAGFADRLLLDAKPPKDATRPGGNGAAFDWTILDGFDPPAPYLLSGGLDPQNVALALKVTGARGVDVSSGVETAPGRKDPDLIRSFINAARKAVQRRPERTPS